MQLILSEFYITVIYNRTSIKV